jgi:hypothetical protein
MSGTQGSKAPTKGTPSGPPAKRSGTGGRPKGGDRAARRRSAAKGRVAPGKGAPARGKGAAASAKAAQAARSRRVAWIAIGTVVAILAAFVVVKLVSKPSTTAASTPASQAVVTAATTVPASTSDAVGKGTALSAPTALPAGTPALRSGDLPKIVFVGGEYCPYCAAERWAIVVALSRFGSFDGLGATESSTTDIFPGTKTFTFHGSTYTSRYLVFDPVETATNQPSASGGYEPLDPPTAEQRQLLSTYDVPPYVQSQGGIPFTDIGGAYVISGSTYDPTVLEGLTMEQIADSLRDPSSEVSKGVVGSANVITAAICSTTDGAPANVCRAPGVVAAGSMLRKAG